jgi:hypothetical protein
VWCHWVIASETSTPRETPHVRASTLVGFRSTLGNVTFWILHSEATVFQALCLDKFNTSFPGVFYIALPVRLFIMSFRDSWMNVSPHLSRRFTTLEGWRKIGTGVYVIGASRVRVPSIQHQFDTDEYHDDRTSWTGLSKIDTISLESRQDKEVSVELVEGENKVSVASEPLYHVFSNKRKWAVVIMIGVAGLFSGLSSNIYFPALDVIAKVRGRCPVR